MTTISPSAAIGVFDSGVGGLTVYDALRRILPHENYVYLGDTARLPYGTKSPETVAQYVLQAARLLMEEDMKLLVVACNTATAQALPILQKWLTEIPCLGVIEPGAQEAVRQSRTGSIAILATEGTVRSGAYVNAIQRYRPEATIHMVACNLMVALAEEGWCEGKEAEAIVGRYLNQIEISYDTLVLGCTHFPLLVPTFHRLLPSNITLIDSAASTARAVQKYLTEKNQLNFQKEPGKSRFMVTDSPERFARVARHFIGGDIVGDLTMAYLSNQISPTLHHDLQKIRN